MSNKAQVSLSADQLAQEKPQRTASSEVGFIAINNECLTLSHNKRGMEGKSSMRCWTCEPQLDIYAAACWLGTTASEPLSESCSSLVLRSPMTTKEFGVGERDATSWRTRDRRHSCATWVVCSSNLP